MFDPNKLVQQNFVWATYVPTRSPNFKMHTSKGHAISALKDKASYKKTTKTDYSTKVIPAECTLWYYNVTEWVEVKFEHEYPRDQKGLKFL